MKITNHEYFQSSAVLLCKLWLKKKILLAYHNKQKFEVFETFSFIFLNVMKPASLQYALRSDTNMDVHAFCASYAKSKWIQTKIIYQVPVQTG